MTLPAPSPRATLWHPPARIKEGEEGCVGLRAVAAGDQPARGAAETEDEGAVFGADSGERGAAAFAAVGHGCGFLFSGAPCEARGPWTCAARRTGGAVRVKRVFSCQLPFWQSAFGTLVPRRGPCAADARRASVEEKEWRWTPDVRRARPGLRAILGMTSAPPGRDHLPDIQTLPRKGAGGPDGILHRHLLRLAWFGVPRTRQGRYPLPPRHPGRSAWPTERYRCGPCQADAEENNPAADPVGFESCEKMQFAVIQTCFRGALAE